MNISKILEKYLIQDNEDACSWNIDEVDYEELEKELEEHVCLENWKFLEYRDKCKERVKKAKELMKIE